MFFKEGVEMLFLILVSAFFAFVIYECVKTYRKAESDEKIQFNHWVGIIGALICVIGFVTY